MEINTTPKIERRVYDDHLLGRWLSLPANRLRIIEYNCERNTDMLFSKVNGIVDFRQLEQFNIDDVEKKLLENSSTERQKQRISRERENGRMKNAPIEKLYENHIKDYIITANIQTMLGVSHGVRILCEIRSNYTDSPFISSRYSDLKFLYDDSLNDPERVQIKRGIANNNLFAEFEDSRHFVFTYVTVKKLYYDFNYQTRRLPLHMQFPSSDSDDRITGLYEVPRMELESFKQLSVIK